MSEKMKSLKKDTENIQERRSVFKSIIPKKKNLLDSLKRRLDTSEERRSRLYFPKFH